MSQDQLIVILGVLLAVSEGLALVPALKANSVLQLVMGLLKSLKEAMGPKV